MDISYKIEDSSFFKGISSRNMIQCQSVYVSMSEQGNGGTQILNHTWREGGGQLVEKNSDTCEI